MAFAICWSRPGLTTTRIVEMGIERPSRVFARTALLSIDNWVHGCYCRRREWALSAAAPKRCDDLSRGS
jgi:hypothetical protein